MSEYFYIHRDVVSGKRSVHDYKVKRLPDGLTYFTAGPHEFGFVSRGRADFRNGFQSSRMVESV